jgi:sugar-phosphatase
MTLRATLFDMDGLLIDSEVLWHRAEVDVFGALGVPLSIEQARETKGVYIDEVIHHWFERYPWTGPSQGEVRAQLLERVGELVESDGTLLAGAERAIALCAARGPVALASSTPLPLIRRSLNHFGLLDAFATLSSAENEQWGKPNPAVFLSAAASVDTYPTDCLVFEDSPAGVLAGKAGRMTVVAVPVREDREHAAIGLADLVLNSLDELDESWLDERFAL